MAQVAQNFEIQAGEHLFTVRFTLTDSTGAALNLAGLSGASIKWALKRHPTAADLVSKQEGAGITIVGLASAGIIDVILSSGDSSELAGVYYHEARVADAALKKQVVALGHATIHPSGLST